MARRSSLLLLIVALAAVAEAAERENATAATGGMFWSIVKEEVDNLLRKEDPEILDDRDDIDGGFSSLDGMLQWAKAGEDNPGNALKLSGLERRLIIEGSHRHLLTSIRMDVLDESKDQQLMESCKVIVIDRLPAGVFTDPFELQHLHELGVYGDVAVFGDTNLELRSFLSNRSAAEIHMDLVFKKASKLKRGLESNIEIPLHARYPAPGENGYSSVQFGECDVFVLCWLKLKFRDDPCLSILTASAATKPIDGRLLWEIPSGIQTQAGFISNFTFFSAAMASITIIASSLLCFRKRSW